MTIQWHEIFGVLIARKELSEQQVGDVFELMMQGQCGEAEAAGFLIGLSAKGETAGEIAAAARVLRRHMLAWDPGCDVLDTCGTGGDGSGTLNISTAAAFVAAGAGARVVKHGNRSVSSRCGSADVLAALGVAIEGDVAHARRCLEQAGLAFCFAPKYHPALRHAAAVRRKLAVPTIFNCLGPLVNPAGARRQLLGVGRRALLDVMAEALVRLDTEHALLVHGGDGLDEVSLSGPTLVREVRGRDIHAYEWQPEEFDLGRATIDELRVKDAAGSALLIEKVLRGESGPAARIVLANAAAALLAYGSVSNLNAAVALARESLTSGKAWRVLETLRGLKFTGEGQP